ncbi:MAG: uracil-DNA glycosylase [Methyloprofundus sp.]|nr:MAG: uracil-DNA glycosylase [Methyloprofundus sp.]
MMDNTTRLQYLAAMGIDVWVPRYIEEQADIQAIAVNVSDDNWEILQAEIMACQQCELGKTRQQAVLGAGNQDADWMWITEAPGAEDEQQGQPFSDHSALLLTEMLRAMQLSREEVFITNIVKCRPPADREPKIHELSACAPFLERQIALVQPKIIIAVGRIAAHKLLQSKATLSELRQASYELGGIPLVVMYHPAYLLRALTQKSKAWQDMQRALTLFETVK